MSSYSVKGSFFYSMQYEHFKRV